jgi:Na+-translocating ferredoxin:NAD+ oxidoreductase RnfE subunit
MPPGEHAERSGALTRLINPRARPCDEQVIQSARGAVDCAARERRWVLVATVLASVISYIDESVVNIALPAIAKDLAVQVSAIQWVINAYTLSFPHSS